MKILSTCFFILVCSYQSFAQSFTGYSTGNYTGVNGVYFNPAYAADSRYHWDFSLFNFNVTTANDVASYSLSKLSSSLESDEMLTKLYGSSNANAQVNVDVFGPALMFNINSKTAFAFTTRSRLFGNVQGVNGSLLQAVKADDAPTSIDVQNNNMRATAAGWMEAGVTWANVIADKNKHFLKGGITLKYLGGISHNGISTTNLTANISEDAMKENFEASNASGNISLLFGGRSISSLEVSDLYKFSGSGFGIDAGLTYEYRPDIETYKHDGRTDRNANKYKLRASVALLEAGRIKFDKDVARSGDYTVGINSNETFNLSALNTDIDSINSALLANPAFFTPIAGSNEQTYKMGLPTMLMAEVDYHVNKGFYLNVATHLSLAGQGSINKLNSLNSVVVTPRIESPGFGMYLPLQVNNLSGFDAGVGLRLGKLILGSSNLFTALGGSKMVNAYIGLRFIGSTHKKR